MEKWILSWAKIFTRVGTTSIWNIGLQEQNILQANIIRLIISQILFQVNSLTFRLFFSILEGLKENVLKQCLKQATLKDYERERSSVHFRNLVQNILLKQIMAMGPETIKKAEMTDRLLQECLNLMNSRVYCTRCNYC